LRGETAKALELLYPVEVEVHGADNDVEVENRRLTVFGVVS